MKRLLLGFTVGSGAYYIYKKYPTSIIYHPGKIRGREENLQSMMTEDYDLLIIGGGATGAGVALEASTRGLRSCLIEKGDFASQTSSKSTKLLHGGVRYLDKAVHLIEPKANMELVIEGLSERNTIMKGAQYMTNWIPMAVPCSSYFELGYFYIGMLAYHFLAFFQNVFGLPMPWPKLTLNKSLIPDLKDCYMGSVIFYDGQMNDSQLCMEVLLTSSCENYANDSKACHIANYVEFIDFEWNGDRIVAARVKDLVSGKEFSVKSKVFVNCTGPFSDKVRKLAGVEDNRIVPGKGSHIILPKSYAPNKVGMLIPKTKDGRVLFLLPWEDHTILGTTDEEGSFNENSAITGNERLFLVEELARYVNKPPEEIEKDILGTFSGERPLVKRLGAQTSELLRSHEVETNRNGLVSVLGGKWTTFRAMGKEAVGKICEEFNIIPSGPSISSDLVFISNHESYNLKQRLTSIYNLKDSEVEYLIRHYGTRTEEVVKLGRRKLVHNLPYTDGEVIFAVKNLYAVHADDVLARRMRMALVEHKSCEKVVGKVARIMGNELGWSEAKINEEILRASERLKIFW